MAKGTKFRADVAERIGLGFELPKVGTVEVVPSVPNFQEMEVVESVCKIGRRMAPRVRLELTTLRLTAECSTIELLRNDAGQANLITPNPTGRCQFPVLSL